MEVILYLAIFGILCTVVHSCLEKQKAFSKGCWLLSGCVSILCMLGMRQVFTSTEQGEKSHELDYILFLYAALAICILIVFLLGLALKRFHKPEKNTAKEGRKERCGKYGKNKKGSQKIRDI